jgi:hypothetical protein
MFIVEHKSHSLPVGSGLTRRGRAPAGQSQHRKPAGRFSETRARGRAQQQQQQPAVAHGWQAVAGWWLVAGGAQAGTPPPVVAVALLRLRRT